MTASTLAVRYQAHIDGARALIERGHASAAIVLIDMADEARVEIDRINGAPRPPQLGVAREVTTPTGVGSNA